MSPPESCSFRGILFFWRSPTGRCWERFGFFEKLIDQRGGGFSSHSNIMVNKLFFSVLIDGKKIINLWFCDTLKNSREIYRNIRFEEVVKFPTKNFFVGLVLQGSKLWNRLVQPDKKDYIVFRDFRTTNSVNAWTTFATRYPPPIVHVDIKCFTVWWSFPDPCLPIRWLPHFLIILNCFLRLSQQMESKISWIEVCGYFSTK